MRAKEYKASGNGYVTKKAIFATSILMASGVGFAGSGGNSASYNLFENQQNTTTIDVIINTSDNKVTQQLELIKDTFNLTDEDLSKACNVSSRKTLSNWKGKGTITRNSNRQRVFELFSLAQDWNDQGFPNSKDDISRGVLNGKSVLNILQEESLDSRKALFAGRRLLRQSLKTTSTTLL